MKMHIGIMALIAGLAFSVKPAFSAPDTGPKVDNIEVVDNSSASADQIMPEQGIFLASITNKYCSAFAQVSGQETVVHRSDHTVGNTGFASSDHTKNFNMCTNLDLNFDKLVNVSSGRMVVLEPERSCSCMIMNGDNSFNHVNVSTAAALHSHRMVWVMVRPGWTLTLLC
ncbi:MAG: hypothetical protein R3B39_00330 [Candidatus Paceibacterota bacterium]